MIAFASLSRPVRFSINSRARKCIDGGNCCCDRTFKESVWLEGAAKLFIATYSNGSSEKPIGSELVRRSPQKLRGTKKTYMTSNVGLKTNPFACARPAIQPVKNYSAFCATDSRFHVHLSSLRQGPPSVSLALALALALASLALALASLALALASLALAAFAPF